MSKISLRVYGLLINEQQQVLVSDEYIRGNYYTKFPGGGLEFGEGLRDGLKREFQEELQLRVEVLDHLYTTDFFQQSAFNPNFQIVSVYYQVKALEPIRVPLRGKPFDYDTEQLAIYASAQQIESFRLIDWSDFSAESVSLPIDKHVAALLKK
ncbi:MAG: NUDIX hydrolase [Bacteroidetes bacterium]|nr:NUDIX hydrolase [Bacteroidota bacterium]